MKRVPFFQLKVYETGIFSVKMVYKRVRGGALGGSLPVWNFVEYPPEPTSSKSIIKNHSFSYKLLIRPYSHSHILIRCYEKAKPAIKEFMLEM